MRDRESTMSSKKQLLAIAYFWTCTVHAMEGDLHIIGKDTQRNIFQVKSLDQLSEDPKLGSLARTACGYFAFNNCVEIMKTFMPNGAGKVGDLKRVIKKFATIGSTQRKAIFMKRLTSRTQEFVKAIIEREDFSPKTEKATKDTLRLVVGEIIKNIAATADPCVKEGSIEGSIEWKFNLDHLYMISENVCDSNPTYHAALRRFIQGVSSDPAVPSYNSKQIARILWECIVQKAGTSLSFNEGDLLFLFDSHSEVCKRIAYGNWLDAEDIDSLIELVNKYRAEKFELGVLNMGGHFDSYLKDCRESARQENRALSEEEVIEDYEYVNYTMLKEIKNKLDTTQEDVVAGFIVHMTTPSFFSQLASWFFSNSKPNTEDGAHWISLVIVRLNGEPIRYYISDSLSNQNRLNSSIIGDIIAYIENWEPRKGSQFDITPLDELSILSSDRVDTLVHVDTPVPQRRIIHKTPPVPPLGGGKSNKPKDTNTASFLPPLGAAVLGVGALGVRERMARKKNEKRKADLRKKKSLEKNAKEQDGSKEKKSPEESSEDDNKEKRILSPDA